MKLNSLQLKIIMVILMVFDHVFFNPGIINLGAGAVIVHALTRCVGVWFGYSAVEGIIHSRNRIKYNIRLFISALIMYLGTAILTFMFGDKGFHISNNIFLTLAVGVMIINILISNLNIILKAVTSLIFIFIGLFITEGGMTIIPFMIITYLCRNKISIRNTLYVVMAILLFSMSYQSYGNLKDTLHMLLFNSDWLFITVLPFINMYNGERGNSSKFAKYFFYVFYPLHLWIIGLIKIFM